MVSFRFGGKIRELTLPVILEKVAQEGWYGCTVNVGLTIQRGANATLERVTDLRTSPRRPPAFQVHQYSNHSPPPSASLASPPVSPRYIPISSFFHGVANNQSSQYQQSCSGQLNLPMNAPYQASTPRYLDVQVNATPEMIAMAQEWFGFLSNPLLAPVYNRHTIMSASMSVAHTTSAPVVYDNVTYTTVCEVAPATTRHAVAPMTFVPSMPMTSVCRHRPQLTMDHAPQPPVS